MLYTVESREDQEWLIFQGNNVNRGPFMSSLYQNDCVIVSGAQADSFVPPPANFDANSNVVLKALRLTFPGAPGVRPIANSNAASFYFSPMLKTGGAAPGMQQLGYTLRMDDKYWDWIDIPDFVLPAFENGYWKLNARYVVTPDFLSVMDDFIGAKYKIRCGALLESSVGMFNV